MIQKKITFDSFIRGILTAMVIIGILYLVNRLSGVLLPFFIAWLIAYLIYPMVIFFQNKLRLRNRVISILVVLLVLLSIITLAFVGLVPPIIEEFGKLKELLTAYFIEGSKQASSHSRHSGQFHKRAHRYVENTRSAERKQFCEYHA